MHIAFLNIQGNFDPEDRYWTSHPDFGGQLVYVKEVSLALGRMGHRVDIVTRRIRDLQWPGFETDLDGYPGEPNVRIIRLPCGGDAFLRKQDLWPHIGTEWVPGLIEHYQREGRQPDIATSHYGDAGLAAALWHRRGGPRFSFTAHSLGAQKLERLLIYNHTSVEALDQDLHFARRIAAERVAMSHAARVITSTHQEQHEQYAHTAYSGAIRPDDESRFSVVPPGVNLRIFDSEIHGPDDERIAAHLEQNLARDIDEARRALPVVICSSRLEPKKNHIGLVLAFARSSALRDSANLLLVVNGLDDLRHGMDLPPKDASIMRQVLAICEGARLWGRIAGCSLESQSELAAAYRHLARRRSVFALTALYEPFGLAPLESAATGLPVCVTRCGGPSESLYDPATGSEYGVLVDPAEPADIAAGLLRLLGPDSEWERFRAAGRQRVLKRYTWEATAKGYQQVLEEIAKTGTEPRDRPAIPAYFTRPCAETDIGIDIVQGVHSPSSEVQGC